MKFVSKTLYGLEKVLACELEALGASGVKQVNRAVIFSGNRELLYKVNYCARTALSVLMPIADFRIRSKDDLYNAARKVEWERFLDYDYTFSVVPVVNSGIFNHSGFAGLVVKDAIADYFRNKTGRRPSVNTQDPRIVVNLHISNENVTISLDSSGEPLFKRGYRQEQGNAPLNEVLAAGMLLLSGWNGETSLTDPMCGSGTIPVEAGLISCKVPPGKFRNIFGFMKWKDYDEKLFDRVKRGCDSYICNLPGGISGSDISETAIIQATTNVAKAGLTDVISLKVADFKDIKSTDNHGYVCINPPYGQRLKPDDLDELYKMMGTSLKRNFTGNTALILTSFKEAVKNIGLKPTEKHTLFNGALECTLLKYEIFEGTRKSWKSLKST
ncbi:MAG: class I SAM-dependent RNA methyltransferase [Bacteroidales bacterium]|nr:class I SAM-dependent RNA methyltransferase [Bacteroidales bacterium]